MDSPPRPMRLAFLEPDPSFGGGSEQVCLDLAKGLAARGHSVHLIHRDEGSMLPAYGKFAASIVAMDLQPFGWRTLRATVRRVHAVAAFLHRVRAEMVICSDLHYMRFLALFQMRTGIPVLFHLGLPAQNLMLSQRIACRGIAVGVAPSSHTADTWRAAGWPEGRLHVIDNGVDCERFKPQASRQAVLAEHGLPQEARLALFAGRLVAEKGIGVLLEAWSRIQAADPLAHLLIAGEGPAGSMEIWRKSIPASCVDSVHFLGRVGDPARLYAAAGVVILPSLWDEPFGLVLAEAMACGAVVVATRRGAFPTIAGGSPGVMLVEPGNAVQLVDAVQGMFAKGPTETDRMGRMNRARIEAAYSVETFVSRYERLLVDEVKKYRESTVSGSGE